MKKLHILFLSILPALVILFCFLGFLVAPNDPEKVVITQSFLAPCAEYPLGTDQYGRCVFSRILYGGYTTLGIVLMGSAIVMTVGILLGLLLGQGKAGRNVLFESILNAVTAIPPIAYLIMLAPAPISMTSMYRVNTPALSAMRIIGVRLLTLMRSSHGIFLIPLPGCKRSRPARSTWFMAAL